VSFSDVIEEEDETAVKSEVKEACVAEAGGEAEEQQQQEEDGEASETTDQIIWLSGFQRKYSVMHDLGKASPYYQERRSGFLGHEHVSAAVLLEAARAAGTECREGGCQPGYLLLLAAHAIARHHAAMRSRHPVYIAVTLGSHAGGAGAHRVVEEASQALCRLAEDAEEAVAALPCSLDGTPLAGIVAEALKRLGRDCKGAVLDAVTTLASTESLQAGMRGFAWVAVLSGVVTVADILGASVERAEGEDEEGALKNAYARSWADEAPQAWEAAQRYAWRPGEAWEPGEAVCRPLRSALKPLLDLLA